MSHLRVFVSHSSKEARIWTTCRQASTQSNRSLAARH
jgi:hypothetical protein